MKYRDDVEKITGFCDGNYARALFYVDHAEWALGHDLKPENPPASSCVRLKKMEADNPIAFTNILEKVKAYIAKGFKMKTSAMNRIINTELGITTKPRLPKIQGDVDDSLYLRVREFMDISSQNMRQFLISALQHYIRYLESP